MSLKLYCDLMSQPARALFMFLKKNNIPFEEKRINLGKLEQHSDEFRAINPLGYVPVIEDNGFILRESIGILRYLCRKKDVPDHWYLKDSKQQARVDEYLEWQHLNTRAMCGLYFRVAYLMPFMTGEPAHEKAVAARVKEMNIVLDKIEQVWLKDNKPFLVGDKITIADLLGASEVEQPRLAGYDPCANRPVLAAWLNRVQNEMNPYYEEAHKIVRLVAAKTATKAKNSK